MPDSNGRSRKKSDSGQSIGMKNRGRARSRRLKAGRRRNRIVLLSVAGLTVVLVAMAVWVGARALLAKSELEAAVPLASQLKAYALKNDAANISATASDLHKHATAARDLTSDPIWRLAEFAPGLGPNLTAVREISSAVSELSTKAVGPLTRLVSSIELSDFRPEGGAISLQPLVDAQLSVRQASNSLDDANRAVNAIDTSSTIGPVTDAVKRLGSQVAELVPPIHTLNNAVALLPAMLGNGGPRDYLILFQNPAELRASGGIPGALALLHADNGKIELIQQSTSTDFPHYQDPVTNVPAETRGLYGDIVGEYIQDVNLTPDFALSAELAQRMWEERYGVVVDGVISVDPVALSYLLGATGPVSIGVGDELTEQNAVPLLLNEAYSRYPLPSQQDAFFAASAKAVFDKLSAGEVNPDKMIQAFARAGAERRILVWNARESEQGILRGTTLAGELPGESESGPQLGVFLNDATGSKMDYYLGVESAVGSASCRKDGRNFIGVAVTLRNNAPSDAETSLAPYITGGGVYGVKPGNIKTMISVYAAPGMDNLGVTEGESKIPAHSATDAGRSVNQIAVELSPGESKTFMFGYLGSSEAVSPQQIQLTPTINMQETSEMALSCESALW